MRPGARRPPAGRSFRTVALLLSVAALNFGDLVFTYVQVARGNFAEANIFAAEAVAAGGSGLIAHKMLFFGPGAYILYRLRRRWQSEAALWLLLVCHVGLLAWWLVYLDTVECCLSDPAVAAPLVRF